MSPRRRPSTGWQVPEFPGALCQQAGEDLWHDPDDYSPITRAAIAICGACRERLDCGTWAIDHNEDGVWGGMTKRERDLIGVQLGLRRRRRE